MTFVNYQKGSGIPMGILLSLVMIALLTVGCFNVAHSNPLLSKKHFDNSGKLTSFNAYLENLDDPAKPNISTQVIVGATGDAFLFFSEGVGPIKIKYSGISNPLTTDINDILINGDFVFKRPDLEVCQNKACVCYSSNAKFWEQKMESPYIRSLGIYPSTTVFGSWEDSQMQCLEAPNPNTIFANSRGLDKEFNDFDSQLLPLEIPMGLQTTARDTMASIFEPDEHKYVSSGGAAPVLVDLGNFYRDGMTKRRLVIKNNYFWEGGVVIGGMGIPQTNKERDEKILSVPLYNITFEKIPNTNITGVCIQPKCLYTNGIENAKKQKIELEKTNKVIQSFNYLDKELQTNFLLCRKNNPDINICIYQLQTNFVNVFLSVPTSKEYNIYFHNKTGITTIELRKEQDVLASTSFPYPMPRVKGVQKDSITITGTSAGNLVIESANYKLKSEIDNEGNSLINFVS
ncbi:hypothetical protein JXA48_01510 [Candidatus Woesearchaeota archaeon]|nr:hypothetical protein [Candidatus Woesearchaeota archaeon]